MLKNLLSLLLSKFYSKKESSLVAHQAMPNFENAVALSLTTGNDGTYVAPADGYINVEVESSGYVNFWGGILDSASNGLWNKVAVPVSKGRTVRYHIEGRVVYAVFINLVGGGYQALKKLILRGGDLCLKSLSRSLRKSSCRVRDRGFNTRLARVLMQWPLVLQPTASGTNSHPAWTGMSRTVETPQSLFWKFPAAVLGSLTPKHLREGTSSLYREVKSLVISFQQTQQCRFCTLSLCEVQTNSAVGGASC